MPIYRFFQGDDQNNRLDPFAKFVVIEDRNHVFRCHFFGGTCNPIQDVWTVNGNIPEELSRRLAQHFFQDERHFTHEIDNPASGIDNDLLQWVEDLLRTIRT